MRSKTSATLMLVLIFVLGGVAGAISEHLYKTRIANASGRPPGRMGPHDIVEDMAKDLKLTADQKEKLRGIVLQSRERYRSLSVQFRPQYDTIRNETNEQIRQILTDDQKIRFEAIVKDIEERHKARERRGP